MDGLILFARYAFMPNKMGFCGPKENWILFNSVIKNKPAPDLGEALKQFPAALIYLREIAKEAKIKDPFDQKVTKAYFVGSELLERTSRKPHHNFHVFNIFPITQKLKRTVENMDKCRITWGKVVGILGDKLKVEYQPLIKKKGALALAKTEIIPVLYKIKNQSFVPEVKIGDIISFHWDWACEILNKKELANLQKWTRYHLDIANRTI